MLVWTAACGAIDPEPATDPDGKPIPVPPAGESWLTVQEILPAAGDIPPRPVVSIRMSNYIDDDRLVDIDVVSLASGGRRAFGRTSWDMQSRTLTWRPSAPLTPGLEYDLVLNTSRFQSVTGAPLWNAPRVRWKVDADLESPTIAERRGSSWGQVEAVLARKCWSCHQDPQWQLNPLTVESMVGERAKDVDAFLVLPRDPDDSYLIHKVLPDYPLIRWDIQPPAWSGAQPLEPGEIQVFIDWIETMRGSDLDALP